jgi:ferredoxin
MRALLASIVVPVNHFFDRVYQSKFNPFYRSGTLMVGLLGLVFITGLYLLFFYNVAAPYQSVKDIQAQAWVGRWMRALHRYATDACMVAVVYHILQSQVQGKTWGPRTLAWISGVVLLVVLLISAWTGYVMVWDTQGQLLALAGAEMMQSVPFLHDALGQAFNGSTPVEASFFFMNLFLHIVLPLGMVFGLWVHTAKLARSVWIPLKPIMWGTSLALLALAVCWPAPLMPEADLLVLPGVVEADWFFAFWLPVHFALSPQHSLLLICLILLVGLSLPWWWKPRKEQEPAASVANAEECTGCGQCVIDCPYEAIAMVSRPAGDDRLPHSLVDPGLCVSCGVCSASCDQFAIGPPQNSGALQLRVLAEASSSQLLQVGETDVVAVVCRNNPGARAHLEKYAAEHAGVHPYPTDCIGTLHTHILEELLKKCGGVFVWGCPTRNCLTREGVELLNLRTFHKRPPSVSRRIDKNRLALEPHSSAERGEVFTKLDSFHKQLQDPSGSEAAAPGWLGRGWRYCKAVSVSALLLLTLGALSRVPMGADPTQGVLRIGAHIPGLVIEDCRELSAAELAKRPLHMRLPVECSKIAPTYVLTVEVDGAQVVRRIIDHAGLRADRPLFLDEDIAVPSGAHRFAVDLRPQDLDLDKAPRLHLEAAVEVERGVIYLVGYDPQTKALRLEKKI